MFKVPAKLPLAWAITVQVRGLARPCRFTRAATRPGMADQPSSVGTGSSSKAQAPRTGIRTRRGRDRTAKSWARCPWQRNQFFSLFFSKFNLPRIEIMIKEAEALGGHCGDAKLQC